MCGKVIDLRRVVLAAVVLMAAACGSDGDDDASRATTGVSVTSVAPSTTSTTTAPAPTTTRPATGSSTTTRPTVATAVIEPHQVAGIALGSTKSQAIAVLGTPTATGQDTDLSGKKYDFLRWQLSGNRGLTLNFRTDSVTSPLLTDWTANGPGPATTAGVQVGDPASKVTSGHGPLQAFCCDSRVASVSQGGGRMIVVVANGSQTVVQITGGDPAYWSRSIAD